MASDTMNSIKNILTIAKILIASILFISTCNLCMAQVQVENGFFTSDLSGWSQSGGGTYAVGITERPTSNGWEDSPFAWTKCYAYDVGHNGYYEFYQNVDVTGWTHLTYYGWPGLMNGAEYGSSCSLTIGSQSVAMSGGWATYEIPIVGTGIQTITIRVDSYSNDGTDVYAWLRVDNVQLESRLYTLSGYVTRDVYPVEFATILLNNSGGSTTSNATGYYSISDIPPNTYSISVTGVGYTEYTSTVNIIENTEKNISMTYATPTLTSLSILDSGDNSLLLGWKESLGADGVKVYVDSQTNLVATVETPYTNIKMYDLTNLEPGTSYNIWCKPYKDTMQGSMYYVSGTTTGGGGGGGGGGAVEVLPPDEDIQPEIPEYPETYDMTNITSSDLITLAATNPEVIYEALSNITIKSPLPDKPGDNLLYFYLLIISICGTLFSSKKEGWEVVTIISFVAVVISLIKLGWI